MLMNPTAMRRGATIAVLAFIALTLALFALAFPRIAHAAGGDLRTDSRPPLTWDQVVYKTSMSALAGEFTVKAGTDLGTTPISAGAELPTSGTDPNGRSAARVLMHVVTNGHASNSICVKAFNLASANDSCSTFCATSGLTCSYSATDGARTLAGTQREAPRFSGAQCVCAVASAASTPYSIERIYR